MASKVDVCYYYFCYAVCVVLFAFVFPSTNSTRNPDVPVQYSVLGIRHDLSTAFQSLEDSARLLRVKRQQPSATTTTPSTNSSNSNSSQVTSAPSSVVSTQTHVTTASPTTPKTTTTTSTTTTTTTTGKPTTPKPQSPPQAPQSADDDESPTRKPPETSSQRPKFVKDNHSYYTSTIIPESASDHYLELDDPKSQGTLNSGHRLAVTISLPFKFRFYGHNITNITVATGGFIYMSPFLHQWLTATQYIAPLMANFDTSTSPDSNIFYKEIGEEFVIEWHNVILKDQDAHGSFIFQAKLKSDGTITFIYKNLPLPVTNISTTNHPVKIGLSDAFYNDTFLPQYGIKRRTIIEYHRVAFLKEQIEEGTVIVLRPLPTCNTISDCSTCTEHIGVKFECKWCDRVSRCSDGLDWYRQDWEKQGCKSKAFASSPHCNSNTTTTTTTTNATVSASTPNTVTMPTDFSSLTTDTPQNGQTHPVTIKPIDSNTETKTPPERTHLTHIPEPPATTLSPHKSSQSHTTTISPIAQSTTFMSGTPQTGAGSHSAQEDCRNSNDGTCKSGKKDRVAAVVAVVLILVVLFGSAAIWVFYAYTHPTSPSGIWLMEHRPSQMKAKLASMKFWKKNTPAGTKYAVESEA